MTGRRMGIILSCLVFSVGVALQMAAQIMSVYIVGRIVAGLGVGMISVLVPMYQSEWYVAPAIIHFSLVRFAYVRVSSFSAPKWIRGALVSSYQWAITI